MSKGTSVSTLTDYLETSVRLLELGIALFLVIVLVIGIVNLIATFVQALLAVELLGYKNTVGLISETIDIVLYLFIVIELYRTIVYVEDRSVVRAVVHAGLIAVVRQIMIFKPTEFDTSMDAFLTAGTFALLLTGLLLGFYLVIGRTNWSDSSGHWGHYGRSGRGGIRATSTEGCRG